jgi:hypothetical protein
MTVIQSVVWSVANARVWTLRSLGTRLFLGTSSGTQTEDWPQQIIEYLGYFIHVYCSSFCGAVGRTNILLLDVRRARRQHEKYQCRKLMTYGRRIKRCAALQLSVLCNSIIQR